MTDTKDIHPRMIGFSRRDWDTGWIFPEIRAYGWRMDIDRNSTKHAIVRGMDSALEDMAIAVFGTVGTGRPPAHVAICGVRTRTRVDVPWCHAEYMNAARCMECLRLIGAPTDHPYQWKIPPVQVRKRHAPKEQGHTSFNNALDSTEVVLRQRELAAMRRARNVPTS